MSATTSLARSRTPRTTGEVAITASTKFSASKSSFPYLLYDIFTFISLIYFVLKAFESDIAAAPRLEGRPEDPVVPQAHLQPLDHESRISVRPFLFLDFISPF